MGLRVLVTGSSGLLGQTLIPALKARGFEALSHGRSDKSADINFDLADPKSAQRYLDEVNPQVIVNLAALTDVDKCNQDIDMAYKMNAKAVETLANWCKSKSDARLIQISTDHIYDGEGSKGETELTFRNVYALSKYAGDLEALRFERATVLRTNFFGKSRHATRQSFSDWLYRSLKAGQPITLFEDVYFSPIGMKSLCNMIAKAIETPNPGVYNLGCRTSMSKAEFGRQFAKATKLPMTNVKFGSIADNKALVPRPKNMSMDCSKFEKTFRVTLPTLEEDIAVEGEGYV